MCADPASQPGDCHDGDDEVHPGVTTFHTTRYTTEAGGLSWDWDCDGVATRERTDVFSCRPDGFPLTCPHNDGFVARVPACGDDELWAWSCSELFLGICEGGGTLTTQACR